MTNISRLLRKKMLSLHKPTSRAEKWAMWRPEQKNVSGMRDLLQRFTTAGELVVDFCARTCSTAIARMFLNQYGKILESDVDPEVVDAAERGLLLTRAPQMLDLRSIVRKRDEVGAAAEAFKDEMGAFSARKNAIV